MTKVLGSICVVLAFLVSALVATVSTFDMYPGGWDIDGDLEV